MTVKNFGIQFKKALWRGPTPAMRMERQNPEQACARTTAENEKVYIKIYVYPLSSYDGLFLS